MSSHRDTHLTVQALDAGYVAPYIYGLRNGPVIKHDNSSVRIITLLNAVKHLGSSQAPKTLI